MKFQISLIIAFTSLLVLATSCNKEEEATYDATITVVNQDGEPISGAAVIMECQSSYDPPIPCTVFRQGLTDANGQYATSFSEAITILTTATKIQSDTTIIGIPGDADFEIIITNDSICGESFIAVKANEQNTQTVYMYDCN